MIITQPITAGNWFEFSDQGDFFRILTDSASTTFDVEFYSSGKEIVDAYTVKAGYSERFVGSTFDRVRIRSTVNATVQFVIRLGNVVGYDIAPTGQVSGTVEIDGQKNNAAFVHIARTVTTANTFLMGSKVGRKYMFIQNNDPVGNIWIGLGFGPSQSTGIKLGPGESFELSSVLPEVTVFGVGDIASNPNVLTVEA